MSSLKNAWRTKTLTHSRSQLTHRRSGRSLGPKAFVVSKASYAHLSRRLRCFWRLGFRRLRARSSTKQPARAGFLQFAFRSVWRRDPTIGDCRSDWRAITRDVHTRYANPRHSRVHGKFDFFEQRSLSHTGARSIHTVHTRRRSRVLPRPASRGARPRSATFGRPRPRSGRSGRRPERRV